MKKNTAPPPPPPLLGAAYSLLTLTALVQQNSKVMLVMPINRPPVCDSNLNLPVSPPLDSNHRNVPAMCACLLISIAGAARREVLPASMCQYILYSIVTNGARFPADTFTHSTAGHRKPAPADEKTIRKQCLP